MFNHLLTIRAEQEKQLQKHIKEIEDKYEEKRAKAMEKLVSMTIPNRMHKIEISESQV